MNKLKIVFSWMALCLVLTNCTQKGSDPRLTPSSSSSSRTISGVTAGAGYSIASGTQVQAQASGAASGVKIDWATSDKPVLEETNQGQKYFYVVNVVRFNGKSYEFPTLHYYSGSTPIKAATGYFTIDGVDFDLDASCNDFKCSEYVFSVQVSKGSQAIQQLMVYIDFTGSAPPLVALNDKNYFMNFTQFYDLIRKYYN